MTTHHTSGAADLPEALRVPLDSLHADAGYLCGRLLNGSLTQEQVVESIRRRIDAAKLAALTAQAISTEPAGAWIERWHGSGGKEGHEGWSIVDTNNRSLVAYLGREVDPDAVTAIVMAHNALRASHGQAPAQTADSQLLQFYGVTTDAELIAAQAAHIEKLQAKLTKTPSFAPQRVREG